MECTLCTVTLRQAVKATTSGGHLDVIVQMVKNNV